MKQILIIGGSPGTGKSTICNLLEKEGYIRLCIDDFYEKTPRNEKIPNWFDDHQFLAKAYFDFEKEIFKLGRKGKRIVIETTGVSERGKILLREIKKAFKDKVETIYLNCKKKILWERIHKRNLSKYAIKMEKESFDFFFSKRKDAAKEYNVKLDASKPLKAVYRDLQNKLKV